MALNTWVSLVLFHPTYRGYFTPCTTGSGAQPRRVAKTDSIVEFEQRLPIIIAWPKATNKFDNREKTSGSGLVGGWTNPFEKYARQNFKMGIFHPYRAEHKKPFETTNQIIIITFHPNLDLKPPPIVKIWIWNLTPNQPTTPKKPALTWNSSTILRCSEERKLRQDFTLVKWYGTWNLWKSLYFGSWRLQNKGEISQSKTVVFFWVFLLGKWWGFFDVEQSFEDGWIITKGELKKRLKRFSLINAHNLNHLLVDWK